MSLSIAWNDLADILHIPGQQWNKELLHLISGHNIVIIDRGIAEYQYIYIGGGPKISSFVKREYPSEEDILYQDMRNGFDANYGIICDSTPTYEPWE